MDPQTQSILIGAAMWFFGSRWLKDFSNLSFRSCLNKCECRPQDDPETRSLKCVPCEITLTKFVFKGDSRPRLYPLEVATYAARLSDPKATATYQGFYNEKAGKLSFGVPHRMLLDFTKNTCIDVEILTKSTFTLGPLMFTPSDTMHVLGRTKIRVSKLLAFCQMKANDYDLYNPDEELVLGAKALPEYFTHNDLYEVEADDRALIGTLGISIQIMITTSNHFDLDFLNRKCAGFDGTLQLMEETSAAGEILQLMDINSDMISSERCEPSSERCEPSSN